MSEPFRFEEPTPDHMADTGVNTPIDPLADTGVNLAMRDPNAIGGGRRALGLIILLMAIGLTVAAALLFVLPPSEPAPAPTAVNIGVVPTNANPETIATLPPTLPLVTLAPDQPLPTLSSEQMAALLGAPLEARNPSDGVGGFEFVRNPYNPFTIIPDRPRSEVIPYTVQAGDTIFAIAQRFNLQPESIAWANDRSIIGGLRPGRVINILPIDGAYYTVTAEESITDIAARFGVRPETIIDSEYNDLFSTTPTTLLPSGVQVVVPGGQAESITWAPPVQRVEAGASGVARISFSAGDPGSCGLVDNPGGSGWTRPLAAGSYQYVRGFTSWHTGVDLSASPGTPVYAANSGAVVFAGWNSYGYGNAIVLAHGPYTTLYGHLSSINARCGQYISAGQVIGGVGSTGDSSGPHLHFEIRSNDIPQDPSYTFPF